jgi:hypothetical protein
MIISINDHLDTNCDIEILYFKLNDDKNYFILKLLLSISHAKIKEKEENLINDKSHPLFNQILKYSNLHGVIILFNQIVFNISQQFSLSMLYKTLNYNLIDRL